MEPTPLNYRPAQNAVAAPTSIVHVEQITTGGVMVRVSYPTRKLWESVIGTCCLAAVFPIVAFCTLGRMFSGRELIPFLFLIFPLVMLVVWMIYAALRFRGLYVFQADGDGITIHSYRGRREWCERLPLEQITDVRIGFGRARKGPSTAWLIIAIKPWHRFNRRLLTGLGGDHLARVADALRAGIGLPARSWP